MPFELTKYNMGTDLGTHIFWSCFKKASIKIDFEQVGLKNQSDLL